MSEKLYLSAEGLLEDSFELATRVVESGFRPTFMVAIWRGGVPIGVAVQELLAYAGIDCDHIAIRTASYRGIGERSSTVQVFGLNYLIKKLCDDDRLLIVDDVFDTGHTIEAVVRHLEDKARKNTPHDIRVAVPYYKPTKNETDRVPEYFLHETDRWIKFPHSVEELEADEIAERMPALHEILSGAREA